MLPKFQTEMCSSNSSHSKASLSRSCLLMLLNHRQENQEHEGEESEAGLARRQSKTFWGHPPPSNRLHTLCSQRTFVMGLHATHMSGECVCDGIDGFIKEEFHLGEEGEEEEGWSQVVMEPDPPSCDTGRKYPPAPKCTLA